MDITVYLPDEIGKRAKEVKLNLSGLLRAAVTEELRRIEAMETALEQPDVYELDLDDSEGRSYVGRLVGKLLVDGEVSVYLRANDEARDETVVVYRADHRDFLEIEDPEEELRDHLSEDEYIECMHALGITPKVDI